ncbi:MAG: multifunctional CCA addition/repair protein [Pseudomonadota bacterium]|nr:multifunctional CCA addition/repair protein [Pseudomonadota bacterium]
MSKQIYLVGGAVRDALLGIPVYDHDWVVVGGTAEEMLADGFEQVGKDFPVFLHPKTKEEYALARTERKAGLGYHGFDISAASDVTLEEDLLRRDLTINAMARSDQGEIIDPYNGQQDLKNRLLRHVSPAFEEDPLRVLRVARFAAKLAPFRFTLHADTERLMSEMVASGELAELTPERVWQEVVKVLNTDQPSVFFKVLKQVGALEVLFPELDRLFLVPQSAKHHPEGDVGEHTLMVLDAAAKLTKDIDIRFAALVHDLGKGVTPEALWPSHPGHESAGLPILKALCKRYKLPKKVQHIAEKVTQWHGWIHKGLNSQSQPGLEAEQYLQVLQSCQAFKTTATLEKVLLACEADFKGRLGFETQAYPQKEFWLNLAEVASRVDNQAIIAQGFQGSEIATAIEQERLKLIRDFLNSSSV